MIGGVKEKENADPETEDWELKYKFYKFRIMDPIYNGIKSWGEWKCINHILYISKRILMGMMIAALQYSEHWSWVIIILLIQVIYTFALIAIRPYKSSIFNLQYIWNEVFLCLMTPFWLFSYSDNLFTKGLEWFILVAFGIHLFIYMILSVVHIILDVKY